MMTYELDLSMYSISELIDIYVVGLITFEELMRAPAVAEFGRDRAERLLRAVRGMELSEVELDG